MDCEIVPLKRCTSVTESRKLGILTYRQFSEFRLDDPFFDSLREDYPGFDAWFSSKIQEHAYANETETGLQGFLYVKLEAGPVTDVVPPLGNSRHLKIGTLKVVAHGTRLGELLVKKALDHAISDGADDVYVTVFPKHEGTVRLLERYGFEAVGSKGGERVLVKDLTKARAEPAASFPLLPAGADRVFLLGIYPKWHTRLFPDSKLHTEGPDIVKDISHSNSIHKVYLTSMRGVPDLVPGDILLIYRTSDDLGPAHYRSVVTSICVVEELKNIESFSSEEAFLAYTLPLSVFEEEELRGFWKNKSYPHIIRFTYNAALKKRITRQVLIDEGLIDPAAYAGFMRLDLDALRKIMDLGEVDESLAVGLS